MSLLAVLDAARRPWLIDAACADAPTAIFYSSEDVGHATDWSAARNVCWRCTVREDCLDFSLSTREGDGMWGGHTPTERAAMLRGNVLSEVPVDPIGKQLRLGSFS